MYKHVYKKFHKKNMQNVSNKILFVKISQKKNMQNASNKILFVKFSRKKNMQVWNKFYEKILRKKV